MNKTFYALLFLSVLGAASCKKDDNKTNTPNNPSNADFPVGTWTLTSYTSDKPILTRNGETTTDIIKAEGIPPCGLDNLYTYKADGTYTVDEGPTKCDPADPQTLYSTRWTLNGNTLTIDGQAAQVTQVDASHFKMMSANEVYYRTDTDSTVYNATYSFTKKQ